MSAELILHIGANKTGSSSIQRFIQKNKLLLPKLGYLMPDKEMRLGKRVTGEQVFGLEEILTTDPRPQKRLQARMETIFNARPDENIQVLMSAENMGSVRGAEFFKEVCAKRRTKIIFYIRRQDDLIASSWQQWHSKNHENFDAFLLKAVKTQGHWETILNAWEKNVGKDNIDVQVFERSKFPNGNIVHDFINKIGAGEHIDSFEFIEEDINPTIFEYVTHLVTGNKAIFEDVHDNEFYEYVETLTGQTYSKGIKYSMISPTQRESIINYFTEENERIREKYFPKEGRLFSKINHDKYCLLYTSPSPRDRTRSRMPSSA